MRRRGTPNIFQYSNHRLGAPRLKWGASPSNLLGLLLLNMPPTIRLVLLLLLFLLQLLRSRKPLLQSESTRNVQRSSPVMETRPLESSPPPPPPPHQQTAEVLAHQPSHHLPSREGLHQSQQLLMKRHPRKLEGPVEEQQMKNRDAQSLNS